MREKDRKREKKKREREREKEREREREAICCSGFEIVKMLIALKQFRELISFKYDSNIYLMS